MFISLFLGVGGLKPIYRCRVCGCFTESCVHCSVPCILFLDGRRRVLLSKLLSGLLRHFPWEAGLCLDENGWVSIDDLVRGIREKWRNRELYQWVTREHVVAIASLDPKGRFEVRGNRIRARYGHSVRVSIEYPIEYPPRLFHGTSTDRLPRILREGLKPMKRMYVHTTTVYEDAVENARRHGAPVVLVIDTSCLKEKNIPLYKASDRVYLAPYIPRECISVYSSS